MKDANGKEHAPAGSSNGGQFVGKTNADKTRDAVKKYSDTPERDLANMGVDANKTSIKEQVRENLDKIHNTEVLVRIPTENLSENFNDAVEKLKNKLSQNSGFVSRKGFGEIQVGSRLLDGKKYLKTRAETVAVAAIPAILEKGIQISEHDNHKGRGYPTITFAGRIEISDKPGIMAVTVTRTTGNYYKVHRVLTPDGEVFKI